MSIFICFRNYNLRMHSVLTDNSVMRQIQGVYERYASALIPIDILNDSNSSCHLEDSDTFGSLRKPLEHKSQKLPKKVGIIRTKSRSLFKQNNDANIFGNLSDKNPVWYPDIMEEHQVDNDLSDDSVMVKNISRNYRDPEVYLDRMKEFVKEKKLKMALDLFVDMRRNLVVPVHAHYTFMIGACGRAGYTEMAFKLLRQMTDRGMEPTPATLTGLFNSCGESPFLDYGLRKARVLKEKIEAKNWELTQITYHAMIKAFGKCGDIQTAFEIVDEMAKADIKIDVETFSFLLMSCIADKNSGFTHAVEVFRKMKERKCVPNLFTCNLLLRAARDCDVGPEEISCLLLQHWSNYLSRPYGYKIKEKVVEKPLLQIECSDSTNSNSTLHLNENLDNKPEKVSLEKKDELSSSLIHGQLFEKSLTTTNVIPSVLSERPEGKSDIVQLGSIKTPSERLALIGGAVGFLNAMKREDIKPSIKTFTLLLECLPSHTEAEKELMVLLDAYLVKPDNGFCNVLMKKRVLRHDHIGTKEVLLLFNQYGLTPDLLTFGILAMSCRTYKLFLNYLNDLEKIGVSPNIEIMGALSSCACHVFDFKYLKHVLNLMKEKNIKPNEKILIKIDKTLDVARRNIIDLEHKKEVSPIFKREDFPKSYKDFCLFYKDWLRAMELEKEEHVWSQYKTEIIDKTEPCIISKALDQ